MICAVLGVVFGLDVVWSCEVWEIVKEGGWWACVVGVSGVGGFI